MKPIEQVSRQRIAQIRNHIMRDLVRWTIAEPHRLPQFKQLWNMFHWLAYKREQKTRNGMKLCIGCQRQERECWHPFSSFYKNHKMRDEIGTYCKKCVDEKTRKYEKEHREQTNKYHQTYKEKNIDKFRAYWKDYYHDNKEKRQVITKRYRQKKAREKA